MQQITQWNYEVTERKLPQGCLGLPKRKTATMIGLTKIIQEVPESFINVQNDEVSGGR